ncbi:hypothetical protein [Acinetobacter pittii]|uniref:hypothetical protein n=1 Tax=Acinetobacter pittii TaxID=48296 RepID=UPI0030187B35
MTLGICKLCNMNEDLQRSHVIGKTVFSRILRESDGNVALHFKLKDDNYLKTNDTWDTRLLCRDCESFFNRRFEAYAIQVLREKRNDVIYTKHPNGVIFNNIDSERIILYFFSIYWRAAHSTHTAYADCVILPTSSNFLVSCFRNEKKLIQSAFSLRIRILSDETNTFSKESLKEMLIGPYISNLNRGFVCTMAFEGYLFELHFGFTSFKERSKLGFLDINKRFASIPYVEVFKHKDITDMVYKGAKIYKENKTAK